MPVVAVRSTHCKGKWAVNALMEGLVRWVTVSLLQSGYKDVQNPGLQDWKGVMTD